MMPFEEGSVNLIGLLVILTIVFSFLLILFLLLGKSNTNKGNWLLSFIIFGYALFVFPEFLFLFGLLDNFPHVIRIYAFFSLLLGPMTYFYVRTSTEKNFSITRQMSWHFIPFIVIFFYQLPFLMLPGQEKLVYFYNYFLEGNLQQPLWLSLLKFLQILTYVTISIWIVYGYRKSLNNTTSFIDNAFHRWLLLFCFALSIPILGALVDSFVDAQFSTLFVVGSFFFVILTAFSLLIIKPSLFLSFPHRIAVVDGANNQKDKYESSKLQEEQKEAYVQKLMAFFELKKPFQSPELTLKELAEQVKIPAHYLSQVINEKLDSNFIDFINSYRVKAAQEMLIDPKLSHFTIVSIAYDAGFSAKSTFYAVFKKHTGMTPSAYRKQKIAV